ncbi:MAG TPA: type II secretion system protein GspM [Kofleriaceae bacterium]|nr:type II secretion system protein GspM [Kofleriaceae bacterium]
MSAVSERARDFWDRISPRERGLVVIAAIAAPLTIIIWLGMAIGDGLSNMEARNDKMRKALSVVADLKARGPQQPVDDLVSGMPVEPLSLETYLTNAAQTAGFVLKGTTPRNPVTRNGFVTSSVTLNAPDLTLDQLQKFLQAIETKSKYVAVTRLDITRRDYKSKDKLDASLEVSTYAKEAAKKPEGSGSEAGSGKKQGG